MADGTESDDTRPAASPPEATGTDRGFLQRMLDGIERVGNKVPHPAIIFLGLCVLVIVLSAVLAAFDVKVTYEVVENPATPVEYQEVGGSDVPEPIAPGFDYDY